MTVKEIFEMRKQGRVEEAYEAIRPMYASHKGKYTTLAMFWTASDILKKRLKEKRTAEAMSIFEALLRVLPNIDDKDGRAHDAIMGHALRLGQEAPGFSTLKFVGKMGVENLSEADWRSIMPTPKEGEPQDKRQFPLPSMAQRLLTQSFKEVRRQPTTDNALMVMPLLTEAIRRQPRNKNNQRFMAFIYGIMGEREKAVAIYRQLLGKYHDSWLYAELSALIDDPAQKAALLCQAITNQRQPQFRVGYHLQLAQLLADRDPSRAAYELQQCVAIRTAQGHPLTREIQALQERLKAVAPASPEAQRDFYRRMAQKYGERR